MTASVVDTANKAGDEGVEGNGRLTAATGVVLLVLLAVEGFTILQVRQLITLHVFLGIVLIGPALLKVGATVYRFLRYYGHDQAYVRKGPPPLILRVVGPFVVLTSLAVLGTGVGLLAVSPGQSSLLFLHRVSFILWFGFMTIDVLGHLQESIVLTWRDLTRASPRRRLRYTAVITACVLGVALAAALLPSASSWTGGGNQVHVEPR